MFLRALYADGPWALTAITPDGPTTTRTFCPDQEAACAEWIVQQNRTKNLYYHANPVSAPITTKATKADIAEAHYLWVDLDLCGEISVEAEQSAAINRLTSDRPDNVPLPTGIVFTGGGYQALWKLAEPIAPEDGEALNRGLQRAFEGDPNFKSDDVANCDRLLRLPETTNWPNSTKHKKGRTESRAQMVEAFEADRVYSPNDFPPSIRRREDERTSLGDLTLAHLSADAFNSLPEPVRMVACFGEANPHFVHFDRWGAPGMPPSADRSNVCVKLAGTALRHDVAPEAILGILLDEDIPISGHCLDAPDPERAARRALECAMASEQTRPFDLSSRRPHGSADREDWLAWMNGRHAVIGSVGGKCRVVTTEIADGKREAFVYSSFEDIRNRYGNVEVEVGTNAKGQPVHKSLGAWWLGHGRRRQYDAMTFAPDRAQEFGGKLNTWRGFAVEPAPGDWSHMRRHVEEILCSGDGDLATYVLRWAAWAVQRPAEPAQVALVFRGGQGTGKGTFVRWLGELFGHHFMHVSSIEHVTGKFNAHLEDCVLLFGDEAFCLGDPRALGQLKARITEPTMALERKGVDIKSVPNHLHIVMASNSDWVVPAAADERRFVVLDVSEARREDLAWFDAINRQMSEGGAAAMLHDLLQTDLGGWQPWASRPRTEALGEQQARSLRGAETVWFECLSSGSIPPGVDDGEGRVFVQTTGFVRWANEQLPEAQRVTGRNATDLLTQPPRGTSGMGFEKHRHPRLGRGVILPPLVDARAAWDERRFGAAWDDETEWEVPGV